MQPRASSFGRKGQGSEPAERRPVSFGKADEASEMERRREAFIAAERARRQQNGEFDERGEPDLPPSRPSGPPKTIGTASLLWFLFGAFGGHHFYLGSASMGFVQISLRLVGLLMFLSGDLVGLYLLGVAFVLLRKKRA